jgi:hypothetical protein
MGMLMTGRIPPALSIAALAIWVASVSAPASAATLRLACKASATIIYDIDLSARTVTMLPNQYGARYSAGAEVSETTVRWQLPVTGSWMTLNRVSGELTDMKGHLWHCNRIGGGVLF